MVDTRPQGWPGRGINGFGDCAVTVPIEVEVESEILVSERDDRPYLSVAPDDLRRGEPDRPRLVGLWGRRIEPEAA